MQIGVVLAAAQACNAMAAAPEQADISTLRQQLEEQSKKLAEQQQLLETELKKLEGQRQALEETQRRIEAMQAQLGMPVEPKPRRATLFEEARTTGRGTDTSSSRIDTSLDVAQVFYQPSILTPKSGFVFEPSLQYVYSTSTRVDVVGYSILNAVLLGLIDVRSVNHTNWIASVGGRYGLTNRLEIEARIPYVYGKDDTISRPISVTTTSQDMLFSANGSGLGDIELAARYQLNFPKGDDPFYIAGLRFKTRTGKGPYDVPYNSSPDIRGSFPTELATGSGFYSLQPSLSAVLPADPAVFFGGINYIWNIKKSVNKELVPNDPGSFVGEVDPGDSVGINFGMGLSLNEKSSFSLGYEHEWIGKTTNNGQSAPNATSVQLASLLAGYSYRLNKSTSVNLSFAAGLTADTPDTTVTLRVPIRY